MFFTNDLFGVIFLHFFVTLYIIGSNEATELS